MPGVLPVPTDCCSAPCGNSICVTTSLTDALAALFLSDHGSPEGVKAGAFVNQPYLDLDTGTRYVFAGTPGSTTGWV